MARTDETPSVCALRHSTPLEQRTRDASTDLVLSPRLELKFLRMIGHNTPEWDRRGVAEQRSTIGSASSAKVPLESLQRGFQLLPLMLFFLTTHLLSPLPNLLLYL